MTKVQRFILLGAAVVVVCVAVVLALVLPGENKSAPTPASGPVPAPAGQPASAPPPPAPAISQIRVQNQQPVGGVQTITVKKGDPARFAVSSDSEQDIHVHGYDLHKTVPAGGTINFDFPATIDGSFRVELEQSSTEIASLKVTP